MGPIFVMVFGLCVSSNGAGVANSRDALARVRRKRPQAILRDIIIVGIEVTLARCGALTRAPGTGRSSSGLVTSARRDVALADELDVGPLIVGPFIREAGSARAYRRMSCWASTSNRPRSMMRISGITGKAKNERVPNGEARPQPSARAA